MVPTTSISNPKKNTGKGKGTTAICALIHVTVVVVVFACAL